jgi:hypothetical protein
MFMYVNCIYLRILDDVRVWFSSNMTVSIMEHEGWPEVTSGF